VHHPAECTAYRLDEPATGASVLVATDVEWSRSTPAERDAFFRLAAEPGPPGLLLFDGHFTAGQYADYVDWGHSTWEEALAVGREARARRLLVVHHSPLHTDRELARIDRAVRAAWPAAAVAAEGAEIDPGLP
jgi:ribonuclease BN (tRNA processing enzyme)